jgi:hypothetical protein
MTECGTESMTRIQLLLIGLSLALASLPAEADELVWATGKALAPDGKPLKGAIVVVYDDKEKIVDYAYTDEKGDYALAIPENVLNLDSKKGGGFLAGVVGKMKRFVNAQVTGIADGAKTTILALTTTQAGSLTTPVAKAALDTGTKLAGRVERQLTPREKAEQEAKAVREELKRPGVIYIKASAPGHTDYAGLAQAFWIQRETDEKNKTIYAAWLDPIHFGAAGKPTTVGSDLLKITSVKAEPSLVPRGGKFKLSATIPAPTEPASNLIVVARAASGQTWELTPSGSHVYSAEISINDELPVGEQVIAVLAYPAGEKPGRRENVEKEIEKRGGWDLKKEFVPNPLVSATRNRGEATITVLPPKKPDGR